MRVPGEGPKPSRVVLIGEAPGYFETQTGRPFVGKSGRELDTFLRLGGLDREYLYVTNLVKWQPPFINGKQQPPSKEDIARDTPELVQELLETRPRWIGAVGRYAARWLTGLDISMEEAHGLAYPIGAKLRGLLGRAGGPRGDALLAERGGLERRARAATRPALSAEILDGVGVPGWVDRCRVVPLYHPASGLHNPELQPLVWQDLQLFGKYATGRLAPLTSVNAHPHPDYDVFTDSGYRPDGSRAGSVRMLFAAADRQTMAIDTEGLLGSPWGLSISNAPGMARVILRTERRQLSMLSTLLRRDNTRIIFHNVLHDWPILREMGVDIDWSRVEDTMLMLFTLRLMSLGLKPTSKRLSGMTMQAYTQVIAPAERRTALEYIQRAITARICTTCDGTGKVLVRTVKGDRFKKNPERCTADGCVDGGLWPKREGQLKWDWAAAGWKLSYGWEIGRYLRSLKQDIEAGVFDSPVDEEEDDADERGEERKPKTIRERWYSWDDDVREPVEALLGGEMPEPSLNDIPFEDARDYSACDADATLRNFPVIRDMVMELDLWDAYKLDLSVIPVAAEMQRNGMRLDTVGAERVSRRLLRENDLIVTELRALTGRAINPASGDQVAGLLFGEQKLTFTDDDERELAPTFSFTLESEKRTKGGKRASTDDKVLEGLKLKYADRPEVVRVVQLILDSRTRKKLDSIVQLLLRMVDERNRIHTRIKPTTAATFRWASADPNLQNIPIRNKGGADLGKLIRQCFIAEEGNVLGSADFDQVELRVLAALSGDPDLIRCFSDGLDPHVLGASKIWRVPYDDLFRRYKAGDAEAKDWRSSAKNINFGIVFGITARGLQAQMKLRGQNWSLEECQDLIDTYLRTLFPGIGAFIQEAIDEARRFGYVRSLMGHIRYVPGVWSSIPSIRAEAERQAANFKIQCSAAELLKAAMRDLDQRGKRRLDDVGTLLLMSVHDELLVETPDNDEAREVTAAIVETYMENPLPLPNGVQITTSMKFASNWGDLK